MRNPMTAHALKPRALAAILCLAVSLWLAGAAQAGPGPSTSQPPAPFPIGHPDMRPNPGLPIPPWATSRDSETGKLVVKPLEGCRAPCSGDPGYEDEALIGLNENGELLFDFEAQEMWNGPFNGAGESGGSSSNCYNNTICSAETRASCGGENQVIWNSTIDGYAGYSPGSCIDSFDCGNDGGGLDTWQFHSKWFSRNFYLKNLVLKNAWSADTSHHTDTMQWRTGMALGGWHVVQDSIIANADDQIIITSYAWKVYGYGSPSIPPCSNYTCGCQPDDPKPRNAWGTNGVLFQGISFGNTQWFDEDCAKRGNAIAGCGSSTPQMNADNRGDPDPDYFVPYLWIIDFKNGDPDALIDGQPLKGKSFLLRCCFENVVIIGPDPFTSKREHTGNTWKYDSIEEALADQDCEVCPHPEPPFLRFSKAGWRNPPPEASSPTPPLPPDPVDEGTSTASAAVLGFVLWDAETDSVIDADFKSGDQISLADHGCTAIEVLGNDYLSTFGSPGSVMYTFDGNKPSACTNPGISHENQPPFAWEAEEGAGKFKCAVSLTEAGSHKLAVTPFDGDDCTGEKGSTVEVSFDVLDSNAPAEPSPQLGRPGQPKLIQD